MFGHSFITHRPAAHRGHNHDHKCQKNWRQNTKIYISFSTPQISSDWWLGRFCLQVCQGVKNKKINNKISMVIIIHSVWKSCMTLPLFSVTQILLPRKPNLNCFSFVYTSCTKKRGEMAPGIQAEANSEYN